MVGLLLGCYRYRYRKKDSSDKLNAYTVSGRMLKKWPMLFSEQKKKEMRCQK